jgi:hypothetical protein
MNDSLYMDEKYSATLKLGGGTTVALKGETRLCMQGTDADAMILLDLGQVFLKRDEGAEVKTVRIGSLGCVFSPQGTAAAVKVTKAREPSVAVVRGKMRMDAPSGESIVVDPGNFGTFLPVSGKFKQGRLPPEGVASLEKWSGMTLAQASPAAAAPAPEATSAQAPPEPAASPVQSPSPAAAPAPDAAPAAAPAPSATSPAVAQPPSSPVPASQNEQPAAAKEDAGKREAAASGEKKETAEGASQAPSGISWEISANSITVEGKQWTRLAVTPDIPIWKFGLGLDLECFIDEKGNFSDKGWNFDKKNWKESVYRKLKYVRFGHEQDPFFAKVGGLSDVTIGYGFIVDRFTNLLHYPEDKLLGVQVYLNNLSPVGLTLQTVTPNIMEFNDKGGIFAGRFAVCPLKPMSLPLLSALSIGATYAMDINEFAPARSWKYSGNLADKNGNGLTDWDYAYARSDTPHVKWDMAHKVIDSSNVPYQKPDTVFRDSTRRYAILGADIGMPVLKNAVLGIDVYGQAGIVADSNMMSGKRTGWGLGAPGVRLTTGVFTAQVEYRHVKGRFTPGYFDAYYLDERLMRNPYPPRVKSDSLPAVSLDGVYGFASANLLNLITANASYQVMSGNNDELDQRFEARGSIGDAVLKRIPKVNKAEVYFYKTNINRTVVVYTPKGKVYIEKKTGKPIYDEFFEQTPTLHWGYRIGVEISKGATLLWDTRYGYKFDSSNHLVPDNNIIIGTVISF